MSFLLFVLAQTTTTPVGPVLVTPEQIATARKLLEDGLRDYQGSRFRNFRAVRAADQLALCGEANTRNGAGGLTGWQQLGVVIEGSYQRLVDVAPNGYTGLAEFTRVCIAHAHNPAAGDRDVGPAGAIEGTDDLTPALQPAVTPVG
ncbi:hypothetical protein SPDO_05310 [Sphingomonas dokdonensis]|uniref:Rhodanese domain-containing protein n=1 Tax=Sphingomonas dokdonensis TaxID=344880 RepID=A0A245ZVA1_9SPHN|nr:hypothetical protein SPDO_05310 [Sphingomonas dokdonensis]